MNKRKNEDIKKKLRKNIDIKKKIKFTIVFKINSLNNQDKQYKKNKKFQHQ